LRSAFYWKLDASAPAIYSGILRIG